MADLSFMVSKRAPAFSMESTQGSSNARRRTTLDDFQDRWLILLFYPRDFSLL
jgi:alkyl hydroperoxide reductase subunit AhpC